MIGESEASSDTGNIRRLLMDGGISVHSSDWFHCSCLLWKGHIMDNWWTLFFHSALLCFYAPYSYIVACAETPAPSTQRLSDIICWQWLYAFFFHPKLPQLWQHKAPPLHTKIPHAHYQLLFTRPNGSSTRVVNYCQHGPAFFFFSQQAAIRACSDSTAFDIYISTEF